MDELFIKIDNIFQAINGFAETMLMFDIFFGTIEGVSFPFVVAILIAVCF